MDKPLIVVTTDFSPDAKRAYAETAQIAKGLGGSILLVNVVENMTLPMHGAPFAPPQEDPELGKHVAEAEAKLEQEKTNFGGDVPVTTLAHVASEPTIAEAVVACAKKHDAQLIALSTHGRTGLRRLVLGSVAESIVRHSTCPVLTFPGH